MTDLIVPTFDRLLGIAQKLMADVPDERMTAQPIAGVVMNHAAWIIGHLAWANNNGLVLLGAEPAVPPQYKDLFGTGTKPDAAAYDPATRTVWIMNPGSGDVTVVDPSTAKVLATVAVGGSLEDA